MKCDSYRHGSWPRTAAVAIAFGWLGALSAACTSGDSNGSSEVALDVLTDADAPEFGDISTGGSDTLAEADTTDATVIEPGGADVFDPGAACDPARVAIRRVERWPGGGAVVTAVLRDADGAPWQLSTGGTVGIGPASTNGLQSELPAVAVASAKGDRALVAVVIAPSSDTARHAERLSAAHTLVDGLRSTDRIAIYSVSDSGPVLHADVTERRRHLHDAIDAIKADASPEAYLDTLAEGFSKLLLELDALEGPPVRWVLTIGERIHALEWDEIDYDVASAADATAALEALRQARVRIAACDAGAVEQTAKWALYTPGGTCEFEIPDPPRGEASGPCVNTDAALGKYPYPDDVHIELTDAQLAVWQDRYDTLSKDDFDLSLRFGDSEAIEGVARLRGQTSLDCQRKSYAINLQGKDPVRYARGAASDQLYLVSMCKDEGYFQQVFADRLLRSMGIFPLGFRFVRLWRNGHNDGIYLILEEPEEALRQDHLDLDTVIRRRLEADNIPNDVEFPGDDVEAAAALARYEELLTWVEQLEGDTLAAQLDAHLDIDLYLRWLAFNSFMVNGDYVDEAFFYGRTKPATGWHLRHLGWDPDDLFSECHHAGKWALDDPNSLLFCAEAPLDNALLRSDALYERFVEHMEALLGEDLSSEVLSQAMNATRTELFALLDDGTAAAMVELAPMVGANPSASKVTEAIGGLMNALLSDAEERRALLQSRVDTYRASHGGAR